MHGEVCTGGSCTGESCMGGWVDGVRGQTHPRATDCIVTSRGKSGLCGARRRAGTSNSELMEALSVYMSAGSVDHVRTPPSAPPVATRSRSGAVQTLQMLLPSCPLYLQRGDEMAVEKRQISTK